MAWRCQPKKSRLYVCGNILATKHGSVFLQNRIVPKGRGGSCRMGGEGCVEGKVVSKRGEHTRCPRIFMFTRLMNHIIINYPVELRTIHWDLRGYKIVDML